MHAGNLYKLSYSRAIRIKHLKLLLLSRHLTDIHPFISWQPLKEVHSVLHCLLKTFKDICVYSQPTSKRLSVIDVAVYLVAQKAGCISRFGCETVIKKMANTLKLRFKLT